MNQLMGVNYDIENELEDFVKVDSSVCKTLEIRDDKFSPVRLSQSQNYGYAPHHQPTLS
jgi:hypothetical protein